MTGDPHSSGSENRGSTLPGGEDGRSTTLRECQSQFIKIEIRSGEQLSTIVGDLFVAGTLYRSVVSDDRSDEVQRKFM
jgi:hypothetical protein